MSSIIKDALSEFINNNTSAVEQAIQNSSHDLVNKEPGSLDLVNYLSCSNTQAFNKDIEHMSSGEKINEASNLSFNPVDIHLKQPDHFSSCLTQDTPTSNQFGSSTSSMAPTYSSNIPLNQLPAFSHHQDLQHHHCLNSSDSFVHESALYQDPNIQVINSTSSCGFQELTNPPPFGSSNNSDHNDLHITSNTTGSGNSQEGQTSHFAVTPDPNYLSNHQAQLLTLENCTSPFEKQSDPSISSFKDSSLAVMPPFASSVCSEVSIQDGLGFGIINAAQSSLDVIGTDQNHYRAPEKMHVDEPESIFQQQSSISTSIDHFQTIPSQSVDSSDVHMKSFSPKDCQVHSPIDAAEASARRGMAECSFQQTLTNVQTPHSANEYSTTNLPSLSIVETPASFHISVDPHHQSIPSTFNSHSFQQSPLTLQNCTDFQGQPSLCPIKEAMINSPHHNLSQQLDNSLSTDALQNNQPSPYQSSQYQDCSQPIMSDSFQNSVTSSSVQGLNQNHHLHHSNAVEPTSFKEPSAPYNPPLLDSNQHHHHGEVIDLTYRNDAEKQPTNFQSNVGSLNVGSLNDSVMFSSSASTSDQHEPKDYIINPAHIQTVPENDPSKFISFSSSEDPLLSASACPQVSQTARPQSLADYEMSTTSHQRHSQTDCNKPSVDITMRDFLSETNLLSSCHTGFTDDSFTQLDLETVVSNFNVESSSAAIAQNESIMSAVSYEPSYNSFDYNLSSDSVSFPVGDTNHFVFCDPCQPDQDVGSCAATPPSGVCDHASASQFGASSFGLQSASETTSVSYHQPMQVQDVEPATTHIYHNTASNEGSVNNTETAMDVSSSMGEKGGGISSSLSYEEIHMSIVKAGNAVFKDMNDSTVLNLHGTCYSSTEQVINSDPLGENSKIYSMPSGIFETDKSDNVATQSATSLTSELQPHPNSFTTSLDTCTNNVTVSDSLSNSCNIFSTILSNIQEPVNSSSQLSHQEQPTQQTSLTIPNFLENPDTHVQSIRTGNLNHLILPTNLPTSQPQANFTVATSTPGNPDTLIDGSKLTQIQVVDLQNTSLPSQLPSLSSAHTPSSFFGHQTSNIIDHPNAAVNTSLAVKMSAQAPSLNITGAHVGQETIISSNAFHQLGLSQSDKASASDNTIKFGTNPLMGQKSSPALTLSAQTAVPSVNASPVLPSSTNKQSHIIVSLEDLQKLLAQQNLSQPSSSVPQQQPYTSVSSSPQTLILQKHASHSLKLSQPRLLIKGATLPNQPRISHPHHNQQQNREKLQLLMHQPSDHVSSGSASLRQTETSLTSSISQDNRQKLNHFQFPSINNLEQPQQKLQLLQQPVEQQPRVQLQLKPSQISGHQQQTVNLFLQIPKVGDQKLAPVQLVGHQQPQQLVLPSSQHQTQADQKSLASMEPQLYLPQNSSSQKSSGPSQKPQDVIQLAQMQQELLLLLKQQEKIQEFEDLRLQQFHKEHQQHLQPLERPEAVDRTCSENMKKDYKHLHSLLTRDTLGGSSNLFATQTKVHPPNLNLATNVPGQSTLNLTCIGAPGTTSSLTSTQTFTSATPLSSARLSFLPLNINSSLHLSTSTHSSSPLTTLSFVKSINAPIVSKSFETKDAKLDITNPQPGSFMQFIIKSECGSSDKNELDTSTDNPLSRPSSILTHTSTERKRSHTPLSIDLNSPTNSVSEPASPLSSPAACEDGNTQLTLIERSADLHIKSDTMHGADDADDDENDNFDVNTFHKRPSADEFNSNRMKRESVPMKIAKPSIDADVRSGVNPSADPTFDFGSAVTSASNFSFAFGNKEDNADVFTFGLNGTGATTTTTDTLLHKDGVKHYRLTSSKPVVKSVAMKSTIPTQSVRPTSRKQKEHSLKAYYPSKLEGMELKILQQPEPHHRARYQTEGSRGAIKDASQQGFPVIKLFGYNKTAKLQVFIGDECGRVKPHGFYQACRVFGKNSTTCQEQEIEDTTVIEVEILPENDMSVKLDCVGILKLRNADVERRIGPKRAREKKKTNTRARLVVRCLVEKSDGNQQILQVVSNPIVCTQPVGQPEICRMSLSESSVAGGGSLFIIGKNFKNKGTSVLFQQLDPSDDSVVWQVETEIEQEFFQPTHLICKVPPYKDQRVDQPQQAQIVVSCAGKMSDPHNFTYKPVYSLAPQIKPEMLMDTDIALTSRSLTFVSPEALHLNRMVQLTNTHSVPSNNLMFQLPQGTIPSSQSPDSKQLSMQLASKPARVLTTSQTPAAAITPSTIASSSTAALSDTSNGCLVGTSTSSNKTLPSFLLEDKCDEPQAKSNINNVFLSPGGDGSKVNSIIHSDSDTSTISQPSYAISHNHHQPSLAPSTNQVVISERNASVTKPPSLPPPSPSTASSLPSKPFFVVVDPTALQSPAASDKIQQLLQHILEAQGHV